MNPMPRSAILGMYKRIMRFRQQLQYTDQDWFARTVRREFRKKHASKQELLDAQERGRHFLLTRPLI